MKQISRNATIAILSLALLLSMMLPTVAHAEQAVLAYEDMTYSIEGGTLTADGSDLADKVVLAAANGSAYKNQINALISADKIIPKFLLASELDEGEESATLTEPGTYLMWARWSDKATAEDKEAFRLPMSPLAMGIEVEESEGSQIVLAYEDMTYDIDGELVADGSDLASKVVLRATNDSPYKTEVTALLSAGKVKPVFLPATIGESDETRSFTLTDPGLYWMWAAWSSTATADDKAAYRLPMSPLSMSIEVSEAPASEKVFEYEDFSYSIEGNTLTADGSDLAGKVVLSAVAGRTYTNEITALLTAGKIKPAFLAASLAESSSARSFTLTEPGTYWMWASWTSAATEDDKSSYVLPNSPLSMNIVVAEAEEIKPDEPEPVAISNVTLSKSKLTYNGNKQTVKVTVTAQDGKTVPASAYTVKGNSGVDAGAYTVKVTARTDSGYTGSASARLYINKGRTTYTTKISKASVKNTKKQTVKISVTKLSKGSSKVTFKLFKYPKKGNKSVSVNSKGVVTIKKNAPKGTYRFMLTSKANKNRMASVKTVEIGVK